MKHKTILIIEDDVLDMKLFRCILELKNFAVLEAQNAEIGIQLAREHKPDMILMDIKLQGMNGVEATKLILEDCVLKHTPIIAVSSLAMERDKDYILTSGVKEYITKPIDKESFINKINKYLG